MTTTPRPTKTNLFNRLIENALPISAIVDVGVRESTSELIACFPDKRHYLFEPVSIFFPDIEKNYSGIDYALHPIALSNINTQIFLVLKALYKDGLVTHSQISNDPVAVDGGEIVSCEPIEVRRFCDISLDIESNFLLKVDVDGQDLNVIRGFGEKLRLASAIVIECTFRTASEPIKFIEESGFQLFDIVDIVYYGPGLYQFDAVFVRNDLVHTSLRPPISNFDVQLWSPLSL